MKRRAFITLLGGAMQRPIRIALGVGGRRVTLFGTGINLRRGAQCSGRVGSCSTACARTMSRSRRR
jgi:hypothetical protein